MIKVCDNYKIPIEFNGNYYQLYSYERVVIPVGKYLLIKLPYQKETYNKFLNYQLDKKLILKGLSLEHCNINDKDSESCLEIIVRNNNIDSHLDRSDLTAIIGSAKNIIILPEIPLLKIYIN
jgi:hypothetical protein